jgi:hypothetical protein
VSFVAAGSWTGASGLFWKWHEIVPQVELEDCETCPKRHANRRPAIPRTSAACEAELRGDGRSIRAVAYFAAGKGRASASIARSLTREVESADTSSAEGDHEDQELVNS